MAENFNPSSFNGMILKEVFAKGAKQRELKDKREHLVRWLRKKGKGAGPCLALADKLERCEAKARCFSGACPECTTAAQKLIAEVARGFLQGDGRDRGTQTLACVSVVPDDGRTKPGKLSKTEHDRAIRRWKERFGHCLGNSFVGAIDLSLNEHAQGRYKRHWSAHIYGVTVTSHIEQLKEQLRAYFPKTDAVPRPVKVREWDGSNEALLYVLKPNFWRRIADDNGRRFRKSTGTNRKCRTTTKARLRSRHRLELYLHLDEIGIPGRVFMRWCQLAKTKGGAIKLLFRVPEISDEP